MMRYFSGILFLAIASLPYISMLKAGRNAGETLPAGGVQTLSILSPHRREVRLEYSRGFAEWMKSRRNRNVRIQWLDAGGTSKIVKDLESRFAKRPDDPGVDIMFGGGVDPFIASSQRGWLQKVDLPAAVTDGIPPTCAGAPVYDQDRQWFGVALSGFGILYSRPRIRQLGLPEPRLWDDLGRPEYFSWIGSGDPRSSGSVHMCYAIILQAYGFEKGWHLIARICANVRNFGESGGTAPREVVSGEVAAGMAIDQYAQTVIDEVGGNELAFVLPERTTVVGPDAIAIVRGTRDPELSRLFIEYVLSPDGQRLLYQPAGMNGQKSALHRMPVVEALYAEPHAPRPNPYTYPAGFLYDSRKGALRRDVLNDLMGVWLIDAQQDLRLAWKAIISRGCPPDLVDQLCAPPVMEKEMDDLATAMKDPRQRNKITMQWAVDAQKRYRRLAEQGK